MENSTEPIDEREAKRKTVRKAAEYSFPTADIAQMLEEIEQGYRTGLAEQ